MSNLHYTSMDSCQIYTTFYNATKTGTYAAYIRGKRLHTDADAIREISTAFHFPGYFGENWNAVDECLGDLAWLNATSILVIVDDFSNSFDGDKESQAHLIEKWNLMVENLKTEGICAEVLLNS